MIDHLHWRYSTQKFDPARKVADEEWKELLEVLHLAPSSFGLQPWKFITVRDPGMRNKLKDQAWGQAQITDASHLVVLCALTRVNETYIKKYIARVAQVRGVEPGSLAGYERSIHNFIRSQSDQDFLEWCKRQVFIPLGMLIDECARRKIDASPMEGFKTTLVDETLGLSAEGVTAVAFCAVGYRASDDPYAVLKKVRFEPKDVFMDR